MNIFGEPFPVVLRNIRRVRRDPQYRDLFNNLPIRQQVYTALTILYGSARVAEEAGGRIVSEIASYFSPAGTEDAVPVNISPDIVRVGTQKRLRTGTSFYNLLCPE